MAGQVKRNEAYQDNFFDPLRQSAKEAKEEIREMSDEVADAADVLEKKLSTAVFNNTKNINKFIELSKKAKTLKRESIELDKLKVKSVQNETKIIAERERRKRESLKTEREEIRNSQLLERQKRAQANAEKRAAKVAAEESDAYKQLSKRTRDQKNESKRLRVEMINLTEAGKRNTAEYRKVASQYRQVTKEAQRGDVVLKQIDSTVGDNFRNVGNYASGLDRLKGMFVRLAGTLGLFTALRGITGIITDFDQAQGDLLAISGKTADEMALLTQQAKDLGATSQFSATQITQMQIELAKLGFTSEKIEASTKAVSNFAAATGSEIPDAAQLAGASLRAFGLEADQMDRVVSTLGVATTKTALDFSFLQTAMSTVAPVAKSFGFSIEDTTALLGQLANSGFDASSAATATRNILLNLADSGGDLAKELGRPITSADDLAAGLKELQDRGIDLASALELTDKRSVAAFNTFIEGSKDLVGLRDSITDVNDELEDMAEKRLDTISGQFTLLQSAWEGWVLSVNEGSGAGETIKDLFGWLSENLPQVLSVVGKLIKLFLVYKARVIALNTAQKLFNNGAGKMSFNLRTLRDNFSASSKAGKGFGNTLKGIGFGVAITAALELASALWDIASRAEAARIQQELLDGANNAAQANLENINKKVRENFEEKMRSLDIELRERKLIAKEAGATAKELAKLEKELDLEKAERTALFAKEAYEENISYEKDKRAALRETERLENLLADVVRARQKGSGVERINALRKLRSELKSIGINISGDWGEVNKTINKVDNTLFKRNKRLRVELDGLRDSRIELSKQLEEYGLQAREATQADEKMEFHLKSNTSAVKENNIEFKTRIDLMNELNAATREQVQLLDRLREVQSSQEISDAQDLVDAEIAIKRLRIELEGRFDSEDMKNIESAIRERQRLEVEAIISRRDFEIQNMKQSHAERFAQMRSELESERQELLNQDNLTDVERLKIESNYQDELEKIRKIEEASLITMEENIVVVKEEANNEILDNERATADEIHDINVELTGELSDLIDQRNNKEIESEKDKLARLADLAKRRRELARALNDYLDQESDKRLAKIEEEKRAREGQINYYQQLAEKGQLTTNQSIKEQEQALAELEKKRIAEERDKQRRQLISTAYDIYQSKVESGSEQPLGETIKDISLLQAFINSIPAFEDGIENTGSNGRGLDGKGGFISMLHPYERVVDAGNNAIIPDGMSNTDLAKLANDYDRGVLMHRAEIQAQNGSNWQGAAMLAKMDELKKAFDGAPDFASRMEQFSDEVFYFITEYSKGGFKSITKRRLEK